MKQGKEILKIFCETALNIFFLCVTP